MLNLEMVDGKSSQKSTRMRQECFNCVHTITLKTKKGFSFKCDKYGIKLNFSGFSNYNQYLIHESECPFYSYEYFISKSKEKTL